MAIKHNAVLTIRSVMQKLCAETVRCICIDDLAATLGNCDEGHAISLCISVYPGLNLLVKTFRVP